MAFVGNRGEVSVSDHEEACKWTQVPCYWEANPRGELFCLSIHFVLVLWNVFEYLAFSILDDWILVWFWFGYSIPFQGLWWLFWFMLGEWVLDSWWFRLRSALTCVNDVIWEWDGCKIWISWSTAEVMMTFIIMWSWTCFIFVLWRCIVGSLCWTSSGKY